MSSIATLCKASIRAASRQCHNHLHHRAFHSRPASLAPKQNYPLYPSVQYLLRVNGLKEVDADKIPATGPNGRLLKGDVLAYVGKIDGSYPSNLAGRFTTLAQLDLSNVKPAPRKEAVPQQTAQGESPVATKPHDVEITLSISLTAVTECQKRVKDSIGVSLPLSTFVTRAAKLANENLPKSRVAKATVDELFHAVLGLDQIAGQGSSRGRFAPRVTALPLATWPAEATRKPDILDILAGKSTSAKTRVVGAIQTERSLESANVLSVNVPLGDERRARVFLERVKTVLEVQPERLVV